MKAMASIQLFSLILFYLVFQFTFVTCLNNISCYQCVQYTNKECGPEAILPCPSSSDRCVTHISKDKQQGFVLKRECGLGPCSFDDPNINRGLGWNICDREKEEYFCVMCCRENACNKNAGQRIRIPVFYTNILFFFLSYLT